MENSNGLLYSREDAECIRVTYVRVVSDLLDGGGLEMTSITTEAITNVVGVLHSTKELISRGEKASLAELKALLLAILMDVLNPVVVRVSAGGVDVVLELDDVRVGDGISVGSAHDRGRIMVDSANLERCSLGNSGHREGGDSGLHRETTEHGLSTKTKRNSWSTCDRRKIWQKGKTAKQSWIE